MNDKKIIYNIRKNYESITKVNCFLVIVIITS